ncbi:hypothetical protein BDV93DRAFT_515501 [Ceratobasidium sp. AG-I]|nr:hypothetical protein BDV93DRAFT_515501 [Ceratobasidium sp. AG-I]
MCSKKPGLLQSTLEYSRVVGAAGDTTRYPERSLNQDGFAEESVEKLLDYETIYVYGGSFVESLSYLPHRPTKPIRCLTGRVPNLVIGADSRCAIFGRSSVGSVFSRCWVEIRGVNEDSMSRIEIMILCSHGLSLYARLVLYSPIWFGFYKPPRPSHVPRASAVQKKDTEGIETALEHLLLGVDSFFNTLSSSFPDHLRILVFSSAPAHFSFSDSCL